MLTVLIRLLTLNAENVIPEVLWAMGIIYAVACLLTLTSVWAISKTIASRLFWFFLVVFFPFIGIMAHSLRCLTLADIELLKLLGLTGRKAQ